MLIGAHISIAGGMDRAPGRGEAIGCNAIQIFTKSQLQWRAKQLTRQQIEQFHRSVAESSIAVVVAHDSYLINLASPDAALLEKSRLAFLDEMDRAERLNIPALIFHPGSHKGSGEAAGLKRIADSINQVQQQRPGYRLKLLLETTAGQGTNLGYTFEQLKQIIDLVDQPKRVGVCLDTCHIFAAGYDLRTGAAYEATLTQFDRVIGLENLHAIHLNDCKSKLGSRVDRHENIGQGNIGLEGFRLIMNDPRLEHIPKLLETPGGMLKFKENLDILKAMVLTTF